MDIHIPGLQSAITGSTPIIILGANGSGKTRLAVQMANTDSGRIEFIPALRNIALPDQIPSWSLQVATRELDSRTNQRRKQYWELVQDIDALFGKILSSHAVEAMRVYDEVRDGRMPTNIDDTVLDKIKTLWQTVFPGRNIVFDDFTAKVSNDYFGSASYNAKQMSDGERTGLYLAARVLDSKRGVIIIDEPETHFHSRLAVRFWDSLESLCPEKRFVYVTHDLNFALSRKDAQIILARPNQTPELINPEKKLPSDDIASILGAASFSVYARRLVFCEGKEEKSLDQELLRAWFNDKGTALIPVGGCENVKRCTTAFRTSAIVSGFQVVGIIDRDHWPDEMIDALHDIHVLPVHEIESLYTIPPVFKAIAIHIGNSEEDANIKYNSLFDKFKTHMNGTLSNKLIYERFKAHSMMLLERAFNSVLDFDDQSLLRNQTTSQIRATRPVTDAEDIWDTESHIVNSALQSNDPSTFLKVLPGKPLIGLAASCLGLKKELYCELVKTALGSKEESFRKLAESLESALSSYLPPRSAPEN